MAFNPTGKLFSRIVIVLVLATCVALTGCVKKGLPKAVTNTKAFEQASQEIKADWGKALSAATAHDYATAILTCRKLQMQKELTPQQLSAVNDTISAVNQQILDGLKTGDQNAIQANDKISKGWH